MQSIQGGIESLHIPVRRKMVSKGKFTEWSALRLGTRKLQNPPECCLIGSVRSSLSCRIAPHGSGLGPKQDRNPADAGDQSKGKRDCDIVSLSRGPLCLGAPGAGRDLKSPLIALGIASRLRPFSHRIASGVSC